MHIPTHQVHNLLNAYTRRLKEKFSKDNTDDADSSDINFNFSTVKKRRSLINKITAEIFDRISRSGIRRKTDITKDTAAAGSSLKTSGTPDIEAQSRFTYSTINENGEKITNSVEIKNSDFLFKQMDQAARQPSEK